MSAETLRKAAALMRERAQAATDGPWEPRDWSDYGEEGRPVVAGGHGNYRVAEATTRHDREHIASWHPAVAPVVADWLQHAARDMWAHGLTDDDDDLLSPHLRDALAVARAYLGEVAP